MKLKEYKKKLLRDPEFAKEYQSYDLAFEIGQLLLEARTVKKITQKELASLINTKQSGIARAESGSYLPSLSFLEKIARALKARLIVTFDFLGSYSNHAESSTVSRKYVYLLSDKPNIGQERHVDPSSVGSMNNTRSNSFQIYK